MNFQSILEELDRLYEEEAKKTVDEESTDKASDESSDKEETDAGDKALDESVEEVEAEDEEIEIVDDEAEEPQLVLECAKCGALGIKTNADIKADEESELVNMDEVCQYCEETAGYKVIGTFNPYEVTEAEEAPEEEPGEEVVEEDEELEEFMDLKVDARGFGGSDNNVSVLGGKMPSLSESADVRDDDEEEVEEGLLNLDMPITANVDVKADGNNVPFMNTGTGI